MHIEDLSKALVLFDMIHVFQILPEYKVEVLEEKLFDFHTF